MNKQELIKYYINELKDLHSLDTEVSHKLADDVLCDLLCELGFDEVVEEYHEIDKWYA